MFGGPEATEEAQVEALKQMILLAHQRGFQVAVHAVGDKAVKVTINSFVQAIQRYPGESRRHYVLHGSMGDRQDFVMAAKYGILLSEQPSPGGPAYDYEQRARYCGIKGEICKGLRDIIDLGVIVAAWVRWHYGAGELAQNGSGSGHPQIFFQRQRYSPGTGN